MLNDHLLSIVTLGPTVFAVLLLFIPMRYKTVHRIVTLMTSIVMFAFSTRLWTGFNPDDPGFSIRRSFRLDPAVRHQLSRRC